MTNHSKITELRRKAAQWRKHAAETGSSNYIELMENAAQDLEREAERLERHEQEPALLATG